ncbi:cytochrome b-c1 complex subunit 9 [Sceloporus undulatus]|uniref:cytochrome b-c1 complex subunit 9 n=1 Tax=Sceloporus undulatus TaxID=8520 RepID=UPI001C4DCD06|nr:cytochrome b-c1 complex subunit 9 [Sceloporus undulatus]
MRVGGDEAKMALGRQVYNLLFRRTSTFALTIVVGALVFERGFDQGADALFEHLNKGKLWKDIKHKYETADE